MRSMRPRKLASVLMRAPVIAPLSWKSWLLWFEENQKLAHLFMICSNIKLTGPKESMGLAIPEISERNQRDLEKDENAYQ